MTGRPAASRIGAISRKRRMTTAPRPQRGGDDDDRVAVLRRRIRRVRDHGRPRQDDGVPVAVPARAPAAARLRDRTNVSQPSRTPRTQPSIRARESGESTTSSPAPGRARQNPELELPHQAGRHPDGEAMSRMAPKNRVSRSHLSPSGEAAGVAGEVPLAGLAAGCGAAPSVLSNNKM
jgi:hypothetical protein